MFEQSFKNIDNVLWKDAGASSELDYIEQTSWILFLKYLDDLEKDKARFCLSEKEGGEYIQGSYKLEALKVMGEKAEEDLVKLVQSRQDKIKRILANKT